MNPVADSKISVVKKPQRLRRLFLAVAATLGSFMCPVAKCDDGVEFFEQKIEPVLIDYCYKCHSEETDDPAGGFLIDTKDGIRRGGETGPAVVPEDLDESLLISAIEYRDLEMPPDEKLDDDIIADFRQWIEMGAPDPRGDDDDSNTPVEEFVLNILHSFEGVGTDRNRLRDWRDAQQKSFKQHFSTTPSEVSDAICRTFAKVPPQQVLQIALVVPGFVNVPIVPLEKESSQVAKWDSLRNSQFEQFINSLEFRKRFLRLAVWQHSFCESQSENAVDKSNQLVDCNGFEKRHKICRQECRDSGDLPGYIKLNAIMLMGLTSREDLIRQVKNGRSIRDVFLKWSDWFQSSKSQLVQRRDGTGWIAVDTTDPEVLVVAYPGMLLPESPVAELPSVPASLRTLFAE